MQATVAHVVFVLLESLSTATNEKEGVNGRTSLWLYNCSLLSSCKRVQRPGSPNPFGRGDGRWSACEGGGDDGS